MRKELIQIELIENYLMGKLNAKEKAAFESKLKSDKLLEEEVILQQSIVEGLERLGLKQEVQKAKKLHAVNKALKIAALIVLMGVTVWLGLFYFSSNQLVETPVENNGPTIMVDTSESEKSAKPDNKDSLENPERVFIKNDDNSVSHNQPLKQIPIEEKYAELPEKGIQFFKINSLRDTSLVGEEGTIITIPENAFTISFDEPLTVKLKEYYKMSDIVFSNLTTQTTDNKIIETGGMVHLEVERENGEKLKLKEDKSVGLKFPFKEKKEGMKLFKGVKREDDKILWEESKAELAVETQQYGLADDEPAFESRRGMREVYTIVEDMPSFRECDELGRKAKEKCNGEKFTEYIEANIRIPEDVGSYRRDQTVGVRFVISSNGFVQSAEAIGGSSKLLREEAVRVIKSLPRLEPGKQRQLPVEGMYTVPVKFNFKSESIKRYSAQEIKKFNDSILEVRKKEAQETLRFLELDSTGDSKAIPTDMTSIVVNDLEYYVLSSSNLGWINCDRFREYNEELIDLAVNENSDNASVRLIFHDYKSIMAGDNNKKRVVFSNVPGGVKVSLFSVKVEGEVPYVAFQETRTSNEEINLTYRKMTEKLLGQYSDKVDQLAD